MTNTTEEPGVTRNLYDAGNVPRICIVTPTYNTAAYLDDAIMSIISQAGNFSIRYHVQDGGSTDGTLEILQTWKHRIDSGTFPLLCTHLEFTYETGADSGMYDAINRGFAAISPDHSDFMTWLNSDDRLVQGALATVADIFTRLEDVAWMGGRTALMSESGVATRLFALKTCTQLGLREGLHDDRHLAFMMQEGVFWRAGLWQKTGGLNDRLGYAGDFDLWRRFAEVTDYYAVDAVFAMHRHRKGQLSGDLDAYYAEVDTLVDPARRRQAWENYHNRERSRDSLADGGLTGHAILYNEGWSVYREWDNLPDESGDGNWQAMEGFDNPEGPYPHLDVIHPVRWALWPAASFDYDSDDQQAGSLVIVFRNVIQGQELGIEQDGTLLARRRLASANIEERQVVRIGVTLSPGANRFRMIFRGRVEGGDRQNLALLIEFIRFDRGI